jgi:hypothetical protein
MLNGRLSREANCGDSGIAHSSDFLVDPCPNPSLNKPRYQKPYKEYRAHSVPVGCRGLSPKQPQINCAAFEAATAIRCIEHPVSLAVSNLRYVEGITPYYITYSGKVA